jgi:hypothetical protein
VPPATPWPRSTANPRRSRRTEAMEPQPDPGTEADPPSRRRFTLGDSMILIVAGRRDGGQSLELRVMGEPCARFPGQAFLWHPEIPGRHQSMAVRGADSRSSRSTIVQHPRGSSSDRPPDRGERDAPPHCRTSNPSGCRRLRRAGRDRSVASCTLRDAEGASEAGAYLLAASVPTAMAWLVLSRRWRPDTGWILIGRRGRWRRPWLLAGLHFEMLAATVRFESRHAKSNHAMAMDLERIGNRCVALAGPLR